MKDILVLSWFWNSLEYREWIVGGLIILLSFAMFCFCSWMFKFDHDGFGFLFLFVMSFTLFPLLAFFFLCSPISFIVGGALFRLMYLTHKKISKLGVDK